MASERAAKCPKCGALLAQSMVGEDDYMKSLIAESRGLRCAECNGFTPADHWSFGTWTEDEDK